MFLLIFQGGCPMIVPKPTARRVILKGLAAGVVYSLAWVLSNHWFFHQWNRNYLGVWIIFLSSAVIACWIFSLYDHTKWGWSYVISLAISFISWLFWMSWRSPSIMKFLFAWYPPSDFCEEHSHIETFDISLIGLAGKGLAAFIVLFLRDLKKVTH